MSKKNKFYYTSSIFLTMEKYNKFNIFGSGNIQRLIFGNYLIIKDILLFIVIDIHLYLKASIINFAV